LSDSCVNESWKKGEEGARKLREAQEKWRILNGNVL
jgi:hypothetical protein